MDKSEAGKLGFLASCKTNKQKLQERIDAYMNAPTLCNMCQQPLIYKKRYDKYCSKSCAAKFNNTVRHREKWSKKSKPKAQLRVYTDRRKTQHPCTFCGNLGKSKNFCGNKCRIDYKEQKMILEFNSGNVSSVTAKRILIKLHGFKCMECGWDKVNPITNRCTVELEHVDGNSQNNHPTNLKLLCPNCHSLTPTYKALNVGNGRFSRRKRYHEGKSS